jgi:hypothetical protein
LIDLKTNAIAVTRFMVVEGTLPAPPGSNAGRTPASFAGVWQGEMAYPQAQPAGRQMVMVALSGGAVGAVVGSVAYPSLACGGELWLMGVAGDSVQLGEHITYGENACASHGVVTARVAPNGALDVQRIVAEDPKAPPATGMLPRRL